MNQRPPILGQWDEVQHDPLSIPPDDFSNISFDEAVEAIKDWFFDNFEDPAQHTPYNGAEGGYLYIRGGPYDARDIVENVFADTASEELIKAAIDEIEAEGHEWVPHSRRLQPPDEDELLPSNPASLHAEMLERIEALEKAIEAIQPPTPGMGHNNPPSRIDADGLDVKDIEDIRAATAALKTQPAQATSDGSVAKSARATLREKAAKIRDYVLAEAKKKAVGNAVDWAMKVGAGLLLSHLESVVSSVSQWLMSLGLF